MGQEAEFEEILNEECGGNISLDLIRTPEISTIVKKRYVEPDDRRKELNKIFVINNLPEKMMLREEILFQFKEKLKAEVSKFDAVFLCDFGHGLIDSEAMDIIQNNAKKLILNCQTNSSNYGLNLITKYEKADYFSLDEKELRLAFSDYQKTEEALLLKLAKRLNAKGWLTRGSKGAVSVEGDELTDCPAFVLDVLDTIGAGDAFFSLAGLAAVAGAPMEASTFLGCTAGALATNIVGNKYSIDKVNMLKFAVTLLKE